MKPSDLTPVPDEDNALTILMRLRNGASVQRYHTARTQRAQSVGEHSHGVAMLVMAVSDGSPSVELLMSALCHDLSEAETGDIPAPAKWRYPALAEVLTEVESDYEDRMGIAFELTEHEKAVLKWCDMMELVLWSAEEVLLGNRYAETLVMRGMAVLSDRPAPTTRAAELLHSFFIHYKEAVDQRGNRLSTVPNNGLFA